MLLEIETENSGYVMINIGCIESIIPEEGKTYIALKRIHPSIQSFDCTVNESYESIRSRIDFHMLLVKAPPSKP